MNVICLFNSVDKSKMWDILWEKYILDSLFLTKEDVSVEKEEKIKKNVLPPFFENIKSLMPITDKNKVLIVHPSIHYGEPDGVEVCMYFKESSSARDIMFASWKEILGCEILQKSLNELSPEECAAAIFWNMTFFGTTSSAASAGIEKLTRDLPKIDSNSAPGKSIDEVFNSLGFSDDRTKEEKERDGQLARDSFLKTAQIRAEYISTISDN